MINLKITRKKLYELVWSTPISILSKEFKISDNQLRNICAKYEIPLPKNGYWMKLQYGKSIEVEPFIESRDGIIEISFKEAQNENVIQGKSLTPVQILQFEIENDVKVNLKVPLRLTNPDKLITEVEIALSMERSYLTDGGLLHAYNKLNITVTKPNIGRALRFMDTLIKALKVRGHQITIDGRETCVVIFSEKIKINCRELSRRVLSKEARYPSYEKVATGILSFNTESLYPKQWKDGKLKIEDQLSIIIAKLEIEGKQKSEERIQREKRWEEERIQKNIQIERQKLIQLELNKFKSLLHDSKQYDEVLKMRNYIKALKIKRELNGPKVDLKLNDWIDWAERKIDWYDPLINLTDPDFISVDKETLELKNRINSW